MRRHFVVSVNVKELQLHGCCLTRNSEINDRFLGLFHAEGDFFPQDWSTVVKESVRVTEEEG